MSISSSVYNSNRFAIFPCPLTQSQYFAVVDGLLLLVELRFSDDYLIPEAHEADEIGEGLYNIERDYLEQNEVYKSFRGKNAPEVSAA